MQNFRVYSLVIYRLIRRGAVAQKAVWHAMEKNQGIQNKVPTKQKPQIFVLHNCWTNNSGLIKKFAQPTRDSSRG